MGLPFASLTLIHGGHRPPESWRQYWRRRDGTARLQLGRLERPEHLSAVGANGGACHLGLNNSKAFRRLGAVDQRSLGATPSERTIVIRRWLPRRSTGRDSSTLGSSEPHRSHYLVNPCSPCRVH